MTRIVAVICILLLAAMVVGFLAGNHPRTLIDPVNKFEKIGKLKAHPAVAIEHETSPLTTPTAIGRVMFSMDGEVLGILFLTPECDLCESRYGTPAGIVGLQDEKQSPL
ncbi:hypothetical protein [uncultured Desulfosarcina sp.]|uniref:hypothetical protein n=1 Tax=uncultured Desulfosarcina sp. TaxID=218289 RepID=UPI0029C99797|nr:hypothetical protein [uncultured Desulfosarcina sp.]